MQTHLKHIGIALVALLIIGAFVAGIVYQEQQPVRETLVYSICYDQVGNRVSTTTHILDTRELNVGFFMDPAEMEVFNAKSCWIGLSP